MIHNAIERGLLFLQEHQYPNGEFCCYFSPDDDMQQWSVPDSTVFPTALIVNCLLAAEKYNNETVDIFKKAIPFFQYQMMRGGVFNHFTKWHPAFSFCPPDIDDTIFSHHFLRSQNVPCPDPLLLILKNQTKNGLFYTWFTFRFTRKLNLAYLRLISRELKHPIKSLYFWFKNESSRNDIDAIVNANVLYFLGDEILRQPILDYLNKVIEDDKEHDCDKWYRNPFTFYYFFSKNFKNAPQDFQPSRDKVINKILSQCASNGLIGSSVLDTALGVSSLLNFEYQGSEIANSVNYLTFCQAESGDWPRHIFYYGGPKKILGWGSEELTTAFCIEALTKYLKSNVYGQDESVF